MRKTIYICLFLFIQLECQVSGNPFSCKITKDPEIVNTPQEIKLVYKGYLVSEKRKFGIVQINGEGYEVSEGDIIQGLKILKISKLSLKYQYGKIVYISHL